MGYHQKIQTWLSEEVADLTPGKGRRLFHCELDLGPGHTEETLFTVGPDADGEVLALWRESTWGAECAEAVAWAAKEAFPEPEVWARLLEAYLRALKKDEHYEGHEFTSLKTSARGPLPKARIREIFAQVWPKV